VLNGFGKKEYSEAMQRAIKLIADVRIKLKRKYKFTYISLLKFCRIIKTFVLNHIFAAKLSEYTDDTGLIAFVLNHTCVVSLRFFHLFRIFAIFE
jgi:hypothetical protein